MKGISPVIATVILLTLAVILSLIVTNWSTHFVQTKTGEASVCVVKTSYNIEPVYLKNSKILKVSIINTGSLSLYGFYIEIANDTYIKVYNSTSPDISITPILNKNSPLKEQESAIITLNISGIEGEYSKLVESANYIKVLNKACPQYSASSSEIRIIE